MSRRVKLYAGPVARLRYAASSSIVKFAGLGILALAALGILVASLQFVPLAYDIVARQVTIAGEYVQDTLTVADTATATREDAAQVQTRLDAGEYLRASEACIRDAGLTGQRTYALTYEVSQLKEKLGATWLDVASVTDKRNAVMNEWKSITDPPVWANPSCAAVKPASPAA